MAADARQVSLTVPAKAEYVGLARLALSAVCRLTPLLAEDVADLKLAITEAAAGLVDDRPDARLAFQFALEDERLILQIQGPPEPRPSASRMPPEERELGRAIIAATVDESHDGEQSVRLVKYLDRQRGDAGPAE